MSKIMPRPNQLGFCPHVNFLLGHMSTCQLYKRFQSLLLHSEWYNSSKINKHVSNSLSDQNRSNTKISRKTSRTFITETLTVSRTTQFIRIISIFINTKLNSANYCANQSKLSRTLRDSSRTFITEFVPSQFKHIVRSRRVWRREEEELKQASNQWRRRRGYRFIFGFQPTRKTLKDLCSNLQINSGIHQNLFVLSLQEAQRSSTNTNKRWIEEELRKIRKTLKRSPKRCESSKIHRLFLETRLEIIINK
jgi:hypothetical protein